MISTDNYCRAYVIWNGYNAVLNNYLEYSLNDNHTVNLSVSKVLACILVHSLNLTD